MLFINLDWKEKAQGDISIWKRARDIDIDASSDDTLNGSSASAWPAGGSWKNFQNKTFFVLAWLGFAVNREHLYAKALYSVRKKGGKKAWTVASFLNDSWQIPCLPAVRFLFATAQSRDNLARDAARLVNREPRCRSNTVRLVFYEMNEWLGDQ